MTDKRFGDGKPIPKQWLRDVTTMESCPACSKRDLADRITSWTPWPEVTSVCPIFGVEVRNTRAGNIQVTAWVERLYLELFECSPEAFQNMLARAIQLWLPLGVCAAVRVEAGEVAVLARFQVKALEVPR